MEGRKKEERGESEEVKRRVKDLYILPTHSLMHSLTMLVRHILDPPPSQTPQLPVLSGKNSIPYQPRV